MPNVRGYSGLSIAVGSETMTPHVVPFRPMKSPRSVQVFYGTSRVDPPNTSVEFPVVDAKKKNNARVPDRQLGLGEVEQDMAEVKFIDCQELLVG